MILWFFLLRNLRNPFALMSDTPKKPWLSIGRMYRIYWIYWIKNHFGGRVMMSHRGKKIIRKQGLILLVYIQVVDSPPFILSICVPMSHSIIQSMSHSIIQSSKGWALANFDSMDS